MNVAGVFLSLFVPWILFCAVYAARTFAIRTTSPGLSLSIVLVGLLVAIIAIGLAVEAVRRKRRGDANYEPMWYIFLAFTSTLAWILAMGVGEWNWSTNMSMYLNMGHLNDYSAVDPARMRGQQMMDAGAVNFVNTTVVNTKLGMGFRNDEVYCVAPITSMIGTPLASYDFWAVGMNCCSGAAADFQCGDYNNPSAHAGLRWMKDSQRAFFRLAVQQAEASYGIHAQHPLFFTWVQDPVGELSAYKSDGWKFYTLGMVGHFFIQLFLVVLALIGFAKVGTY